MAGRGEVDTLVDIQAVVAVGGGMGLIRWFTKNWADTRTPTHSDLEPLTVTLSVEAAQELVKKAVAESPRWSFVESPKPGELHLTRRTRAMRFVDDVMLTFQPDHSGATVIHAASRSRVGVGDLGQNRRNILELWKIIRNRL
jgi:uncharacterized protein (DUF1499 family)